MRVLLASLFTGAIILWGGCSGSDWATREYKDTKGESHTPAQLAGDSGTVFVFLSPECPLCINYAARLKNIHENWQSKGVEMIGISSGDYYTASELEGYKIKHELDFPILMDPDFEVADGLNAEVTPEVFLCNTDMETVYSGAIDNWAISLGRKRVRATEHYLEDALMAHANGKMPKTSETDPVGCFIE